MTRREFLQAGGLGAIGLTLTDLLARPSAEAARIDRDKRCIVLFLCGGPSQIDTWDPKPDAPAEIRGPFRPIATNVPGIEIAEPFPRMARIADRYSLVRSMYHTEAPIHETGHQLMQTGYLFRGGLEYPHYGSVLAKVRGRRGSVPPHVVVPGPIGNTGVSVPHGQDAGYLGDRCRSFYLNADPAGPRYKAGALTFAAGAASAQSQSPGALHSRVDGVPEAFDGAQALAAANRREDGISDWVVSENARRAFDLADEKPSLRDRYGRDTFGQSCLLARRLVEHGVHLVTVNMFDTVFDRVTWDCHANGGDLSATLDDYKTTLCPMFDRAFTTLVTDLYRRGRLEDTLVVAMGEFGRTYKLNSRGGRDHWPGVWTTILAGGGVRGGRIIGASDRNGAEPKDRPVHPSELAASIYYALGVDLSLRLSGPQNQSLPLVQAEPVLELF